MSKRVDLGKIIPEKGVDYYTAAEKDAMENEVTARLVGLYKKYTSIYTTLVPNETEIPINITAYDENAILDVFIEGRVLNNSEYTVADNYETITLTTALSEIGTVVQFVVYKFAQIDSEDYDMLKGEPGDLSHNDIVDNLNSLSSTKILSARQGNILAQRINSVASGSPAGVYATVSDLTTADPDHSKIYVVSADGHWYYHNGTSWADGGKYQSTGIGENEIKIYQETIIIKNSIIPPDNWEINKIINASGEVISYSNSSVSSNIVNVTPNEKYVLIVKQHPTQLYNKLLRIASYNSNDEFIQRDDISLFGGNTAIYTVPQNCSYLKFCVVGLNINNFYPDDFPVLINENLIPILIDYTKSEYLNPSYSILDNKNIVIQNKIFFYPLDKDNKAYASYISLKNKYTMNYTRTITQTDYPLFTVYSNSLHEGDKLRIKLSLIDRTHIISVGMYPVPDISHEYNFTYNPKTDEYELILTSEMITNCVTNNKFRVSVILGNISESTDFDFDVIININNEFNNFDDIIQSISKKQKYNNATLSILGDSYSTYQGWLPDNYLSWYNDAGNTSQNDVDNVNQTWWYKLIEDLKATLLINNSYSGSTICNTGYNGADSTSTSFITRMKKWNGEDRKLEPKPNLIIIMGGTNDTWAGSPVGSLKYSGWTNEDLKQVLPAFCYMLYYLKEWNPGATIVNVVNTDISSSIKTGMQTACEHYGIINVTPDVINKDSGHPNKNGMIQIKNAIEKNIYQEI